MSANSYGIAEIQGFLSQVYGKNVPDGKGGASWQVPPLTVYPYGFNTTFLALAQNTTQTNVVQITANADFIMMSLDYRAQIGAAQTLATKTAAFVRCLITDSGTNEQFTAQAVDLENYATNGSFDRSLPYPRFIAGKSSLTVQVTNYAPVVETYTSLDIFFEGVLCRVRG
jgi:hypothetical protein